MDNSLVYAFEGYVGAVFKDIAPTYGSVSDWERDKNRSLHELAHRGMRFLTIDLPALRKHFEKCLEEGQYTRSDLYLSSMVSKRIQVPAFARNLYLQVFDVQGKLKPEPNICAIADLRQLFEGVGKLFLLCKQEAIDEEVENFLTIENELREPTHSWILDNLFEVSDPRDVSFSDSIADTDSSGFDFLSDTQLPSLQVRDASTLQRVCDIVASTFGDLHLERDDEMVTERPRHGKGRVSNLKKSQSKFDFSKWPSKLDRIFHYDRYATHDLGYQAYLDTTSGKTPWVNQEDPSKLIAVPKTMSGPRLIGSEPNYHQWAQQTVLAQILARIGETPLRHCVFLKDQSKNRDLAQSSSRSGAYATVDLKSASDRLTCWTIERAFRSNITMLERIHASRTRTMKVGLRGKSSVIRLKKCFTQGSACTFPVQTLVYSMVAITAIIITDNLSVCTRNITRAAQQTRVFGDDIIVPTSSLPKLVEILSFLQLKVNLNKTFWKGKFRESCGMDAYDGVDVTPAKIRAFSTNPSHDIAISMQEGSNNFFKRGMWHVSEWIQSYLRRYNLPIVAVNQVTLHDYRDKAVRDSGGLSSFCGEYYGHLKQRYNRSLFRREARFHFLVSNSKKVPTQSAHDVTEYLFSNDLKSSKVLDYLDPQEGGLGVVNKIASVMKQGWRPI